MPASSSTPCSPPAALCSPLAESTRGSTAGGYRYKKGQHPSAVLLVNYPSVLLRLLDTVVDGFLFNQLSAVIVV